MTTGRGILINEQESWDDTAKSRKVTLVDASGNAIGTAHPLAVDTELIIGTASIHIGNIDANIKNSSGTIINPATEATLTAVKDILSEISNGISEFVNTDFTYNGDGTTNTITETNIDSSKTRLTTFIYTEGKLTRIEVTYP